MARNSLTPMSGHLVANDPFWSLQQGVSRLVDDMLSGAGMPLLNRPGQDQTLMMPQMNVSETDSEIRVTAELPGVAEKDVDVTLDDDVLTIRGEKKLENKEDKENYHFVERSFGRFQRSLRVPHTVKPDQVQARVENGVLTVILPKSSDQEKIRHIQVQGSTH